MDVITTSPISLGLGELSVSSGSWILGFYGKATSNGIFLKLKSGQFISPSS
ncbi:hypothetical protein RHMOL_Rhmol06G0239100 [Rhododendron molle]|uniref:Uncharacterized protein n=1 Tax=Rhododendron molle TaxID=49168 RepID=A0ACC0NH84_RHOML|nr:hypothetical protein RHMOL_Rhmol06G0239100 [Rhododendron molle]